MRRTPLGRGLASLIHEVPEPAPISQPQPLDLVPPEDRTLPGSWPSEHPEALTSASARKRVQAALEKLSTRPRLGLKAARLYLDHLRQIDGRTHTSLNLSGVDLTSCSMLQLKRGRIEAEKRFEFCGVSIWLK